MDRAVRTFAVSAEPGDRGALAIDHPRRGCRKSELLARHRVAEYWLADPQARTLEVRLERAGRYPDPIVLDRGTYQSATLPGLTIDVEALFA